MNFNTNKPLPQNVQAEEMVIGALIIDGKATETIDAVSGILEDKDFYIEAHRTLYKGILDMKLNNVPIDMFTIFNWFKDNNLEIKNLKQGLSSYLAYLTEITVSSANVLYYAKLVKEASIDRALMQEASRALYEFQEGGKTREDTTKLLTSIIENISNSTLTDNIPLISIMDILSNEGSTLSYFVDDLLPKGSVVGFTAPPGLYKTWLALSMSNSISTGRNFLGRGTEKASVYYINFENPTSLFRDRLELLGITDHENFKFWNYQEKTPPPLIYKIEPYRQLAKENSVLIFDSLIRTHQGDENSSKDMSKVMDAFRSLTKEGASVVLLHHKGKSEFAYRGSSEILAGVDVLFSLDKDGDILRLRTEKHRFQPEFTICMKFHNENGIFTFQVTNDPMHVKEQEDLDSIKEIIKALNDGGIPPNQTQIVQKAKELRTPLSRNKILKLLDKGERRKIWVKTEGYAKNEKIYKLTDPVVLLSHTYIPGTTKQLEIEIPEIVR